MRPSEKGFSLIEMCVVMLIGGFVLVAGLYLLRTTMQVHGTMQKSITERDIQHLIDAIEDYIAANGAPPCPASLEAPLGADTFGRPVASNCAQGKYEGTTLVSGVNGYPVRIGAVPIAVLGVSTDLAFDRWGNRLTYAASADPAKPGGISIIGPSGNALVEPAGSTQFVVVSHGHDGKGGHGRVGVGKDCAGPDTLEGENCNGDHIFRVAEYSKGTDVYDDLVRFSSLTGGEAPPPGGEDSGTPPAMDWTAGTGRGTSISVPRPCGSKSCWEMEDGRNSLMGGGDQPTSGPGAR